VILNRLYAWWPQRIGLFAKHENEIRYQNTQMAIHRQDKKYRIYMT